MLAKMFRRALEPLDARETFKKNTEVLGIQIAITFIAAAAVLIPATFELAVKKIEEPHHQSTTLPTDDYPHNLPSSQNIHIDPKFSPP